MNQKFPTRSPKSLNSEMIANSKSPQLPNIETLENPPKTFQYLIAFRRPTGSEQKVPSTGVADEIKSTNPDHIGGYEVALPILTGIETKFGLCLPRFQAAPRPQQN